ncbi:trigger factor [Sphingomonas sinipercae]|uniref:Trigger factor n=1 Tax=Sphingomonas sinipercae TaxID=2714944 RepID=A0A6G7ZQY5_9SPHN|nr:trigger factor [Sphingomonas sinipercae]QIL03339.1 trigger factor [Sphingomonas sinipercae]
MKTVETQNEGLKRAFMLTIPAKDIEQRVEQEVKRIAPQVRMPGFRPGKVPPNLIKKMHGDSLQSEALNRAVQDGVQQLLQEQKLRPAMQPQVELNEAYAPGKDAEVSVSLEALPEIPTPSIDGLKLERLMIEPDETIVDEQIQRLVSSNKSWSDAKKGKAAENGDAVVVDFEGRVGGELFEGGKGEDMTIELGSGQLIPGFEEQLVGAKAGEQRDVNVTFPKDYPAENLKGKDATFAVTVKGVKIAGEGKADDEFAKQLGLKDLDQLRGLIRDQQAQELNGLTRTHMKRRLLDQLAERSDFDVPPSMVEAEFQGIMQQLRHEAGHEEDSEAALAEIEKDAGEYRKIAERRVRLGLVLSEIGAANNVEITQAEMNRLIGQAASQYQDKDRERFIEYVQQEPAAAAQLRAPLYEDKVVDFLFSKAEVSDRTATRAELEADLESEEGHVHGPGCGHDHGEAAAKPKGKGKGKKQAAEAPAAKEAAGKKAKPAPAKAAPAKAKLTGDATDAPKPAKPLKSEPANKAQAAKVEADKPKKAAAKKPAKK